MWIIYTLFVHLTLKNNKSSALSPIPKNFHPFFNFFCRKISSLVPFCRSNGCQRRAHDLYEFLRSESNGLACRCRSAHFMVGRNHCPILRGFSHVLQPSANGKIRGLTLPDKVSLDHADLPRARLPCGRAVEVNLDPVARDPRKVLQEADEFFFIVRVFEAQSEFGNQVVSVNQIGHEAIVLNTCKTSP